MRLSVNNEEYSSENEKLANMAYSLGWNVDDSKLYYQGLMFLKGNTYIWKCRSVRIDTNTNTPLIWQVSDVIEGRFCNHRAYNENELERALTEN